MISRIAVVIPACNEETLIGACLASVTAAASIVQCQVEIIVVLDNCTDTTATEVSKFADVVTIATSVGNAGHARRLGCEHALRHGPVDELLLASTDADSEVPAHWLTGMQQYLACADLVLGTVLPGPGLTSAVEAAWHDQHDLLDGHPFVHAANLGISAGAYRSLGGWRPLPSGEDTDLADRAVAARLRVHRAAGIAVLTSTRSVGRAQHGFSSYLRALSSMVDAAPDP